MGPLKDLSLKDVIVTSSPAARVWGACNEQLGLIAAASQSQGRRPSQEDRITVAPSLAHALAAEGKVRWQPRGFRDGLIYLFIYLFCQMFIMSISFTAWVSDGCSNRTNPNELLSDTGEEERRAGAGRGGRG